MSGILGENPPHLKRGKWVESLLPSLEGGTYKYEDERKFHIFIELIMDEEDTLSLRSPLDKFTWLNGILVSQQI